MTWTAPPGTYGSADPLYLLLLALAIEAYVGDRPLLSRWVPHPRRIVARLVAGLRQRLDRAERGPRARLVRGALVALFLVLLAAAAGVLAALFTRHYPFAWVAEALLLILAVAQRSTWVRTAVVLDALDSGSLIRAREALRPLADASLPSARLERLDRSGVALAALGALGRRFVGGLVSPVFWYVLFGLPGLFVQQAVAVAAAQFEARTEGFGATALRLDRALGLLPDRLAGLLLAAATLFVPGTRPGLAFKRLSGSTSWSVAALGGALGLASSDAAVQGADARRLAQALGLFTVGCLLVAALVALLALLRLAL